MTYAVKTDFSTCNIVSHAIRPYFEAPLANTFPFEFFYFRRWPFRIMFKLFKADDYFIMNRKRDTIEISLKRGGEKDGVPDIHINCASNPVCPFAPLNIPAK